MPEFTHPHTLTMTTKTEKKIHYPGGWRDDSVIRSTGCSSRGPGFNSQHYTVAHNYLTPGEFQHPLLALVCNEDI